MFTYVIVGLIIFLTLVIIFCGTIAYCYLLDVEVDGDIEYSVVSTDDNIYLPFHELLLTIPIL